MTLLAWKKLAITSKQVSIAGNNVDWHEMLSVKALDLFTVILSLLERVELWDGVMNEIVNVAYTLV